MTPEQREKVRQAGWLATPKPKRRWRACSTEEERVLGDTLEAILRTVAIQNAGLAVEFYEKAGQSPPGYNISGLAVENVYTR